MKTLFFTLFIFWFSNNSKAQCSIGAAKNCSTATSNTVIGNTSWSNPGYASISDNQFAEAKAIVLGDNSNYLVATGFGFAIPASATICGIKAEIQRREIGLYGVVSDNSVKIVKNGLVSGNEKKLVGQWPTSRAYATYGSSIDLWGQSWLNSDINSASFGIAISANLSGTTVLPSALIDHIQITVYYSSTLPIELIYFNAECISNQLVDVSWTTASQTNNSYFTVEKSMDGITFDVIDSVKGAGTSNQSLNYSIKDLNLKNNLNYYRLNQIDFNGNHQYSNIIESSCGLSANDFISYPNPTFESLAVKGNGRVSIYNMLGETIYSSIVEEQMNVDLSKHPKGTYSIIFDTSYRRLTKKIIIQ